MRQSLANTLEVLLRHGSVPVGGNTTAARVVSKADQSTVLIGIEFLSIRELADTLLEADDVLLEEVKSLGLGKGWVDASAALLDTVVAVT